MSRMISVHLHRVLELELEKKHGVRLGCNHYSRCIQIQFYLTIFSYDQQHETDG